MPDQRRKVIRAEHLQTYLDSGWIVLQKLTPPPTNRTVYFVEHPDDDSLTGPTKRFGSIRRKLDSDDKVCAETKMCNVAESPEQPEVPS